MTNTLYKFAATPGGITLNGLPLTKQALSALPPQSMRYIKRAGELLAKVRKEDWDNRTPHDSRNIPLLAKVQMLLALASPQALETFSPDQPRVPAGSGRQSGQWTKGFDVAGATAYLRRHAHNASTRNCARYVANAIRQGGGLSDLGHPAGGEAKDYGPNLTAAGFTAVAETSAVSGNAYPPAGYAPQAGDVAVIQPYPGGSKEGHMTMYDGTQWISDFRQQDMWSGTGYRNYQPAYAIYRH